MADSLTVTSDSALHQPFSADDGAYLQQTRGSEALGVQPMETATLTPPEADLMEFLRTESAGSQHDTNLPTSNPYLLGQIGLIILVSVLLLGLFMFYHRLFHRKLNSPRSS